MSWLKRLFGAKAQATPDVESRGWETLVGQLVTPPRWLAADDLWHRWTVEQRERLLANSSIVWACVRYIATAASQVRVEMRDAQGQVIMEHRILDLLRRPNHLQTYAQMIQRWVTCIETTGVGYIWMWRNRAGEVAELWPVPTSWVEARLEAGPRLLAGFTIRQGARRVDVPATDMIWAGYADPSRVWGWISPLEAASRDIELEREREAYIIEMLANTSRPGVVLKQAQDTMPLTAEQREELRASFAAVAGRAAGTRGGTPVLPPGFDIEYPGLLDDLDWPGLSTMTETRICAAYGVPPILVGCRSGLERSTYANYATARRAFAAAKLAPLWDLLDDALTVGLCEGVEAELRYRQTDIPELGEDLATVAERAAKLASAGLITRNEARRMVGLGEVEHGDVYLMPVSMMEVSVDGGEAAE